MGTVAITDKLKLEITNYVCKPFNERYFKANTLSFDESQAMYDKLLVTPHQVSLMDQLPDRWHTMFKSTGAGKPIYIAHQKQHWLELNIEPNKHFYYLNSWGYGVPNKSGSNVEAVSLQWLTFDLATECSLTIGRNPIQDLISITAERDSTLATINKMLDGCKTLNQVEKLWPAIRKYVDKDTLARLDRKPAKVSISQVGIDKDSLDALSVHHIRTQMTS